MCKCYLRKGKYSPVFLCLMLLRIFYSLLSTKILLVATKDEHSMKNIRYVHVKLYNVFQISIQFNQSQIASFVSKWCYEKSWSNVIGWIQCTREKFDVDVAMPVCLMFFIDSIHPYSYNFTLTACICIVFLQGKIHIGNWHTVLS